jgi:hypothetical protein
MIAREADPNALPERYVPSARQGNNSDKKNGS